MKVSNMLRKNLFLKVTGEENSQNRERARKESSRTCNEFPIIFESFRFAQDPIRQLPSVAEKTSRKYENAREKIFTQIFLEKSC
jgi:hypothetical protein